MKLLSYEYEACEALGILDNSGEGIIPLASLGIHYSEMNELIQKASPQELAQLKTASQQKQGELELGAVVKLAPIPVPLQDVICVGFNYIDHVEESENFKNITSGTPKEGRPEYPVYFSKRVFKAVPDDGKIISRPDLDLWLDYEIELGVVIGKDAKDVPQDKAQEYIFGYTIINDISARMLQARHKQFYFGKSLDSSCPMGPWIVTQDEFPHPLNIELKLHVNGELRQKANTKDMLFSIPRIISELSCAMTLRSGTIISTGTPSGVGAATQSFLKKGDLVECFIQGIGELRNVVE